jgi:hypothetical protein
MKLPFAMLCLGASMFCLWIAFHDIGPMLAGESLNPTNILNLISSNFAR